MTLHIIDTELNYTVHCHEGVFLPEENHTEAVLRQATHFEDHAEAMDFANTWSEYVGYSILTAYGKPCPCSFCSR